MYFFDFVRFFAYLKVKSPSSSNAIAHTICVLPETRLFLPRHSGVTTRSALFLAWVATPGTRYTERALVNLRDVTQYVAYARIGVSNPYTVSIIYDVICNSRDNIPNVTLGILSRNFVATDLCQ